MKKLSDILDISPDITLETLQRARMAALTLIKWLLCSLFTGSFIGLIGALFYKALQYTNKIREAHSFWTSSSDITLVMNSFFSSSSGYPSLEPSITVSQSFDKNFPSIPKSLPCLAALLKSLLST